MNDSEKYVGHVYRAPSEEWAWTIYRGTEILVSGAGYETVDDARHECGEHLSGYDENAEFVPVPPVAPSKN